MKKFIGKSAAIAAAALLFAQTVPMVNINAAYSEGNNKLTIKSFTTTATIYDSLKNNAGSGMKDDTVSGTPKTGLVYNMYPVSAQNDPVITSTPYATVTTDNDGVAKFEGIENGTYWVDPVDTTTNPNFSNADGFYINFTGDNDVYVYPKYVDNGYNADPAQATANHTVEFTKKGKVPGGTAAALEGVSYKVYFKNMKDEWEAAKDADGQVSVFTTDSNGKITLAGLPLGDYYFVEQDSDANADNTITIGGVKYLVDQTPQKVQILADASEMAKKEVENDRALNVTKKIANDGAGTKFNWIIEADIPSNPSNLLKYDISDIYTNSITGVTVKKVTADSSELTKSTNHDKDYTLTTDESNKTITVSFDKFDNLSSKSKIMIYVESTVNGEPTLAENKTSINYQYAYKNPTPQDPSTPLDPPIIPDIVIPNNNPDVYPKAITEEPASSTKVTLGEFTISNIEQNDSNNTELAGAKYQIKSDDGTQNIGSVLEDDSTNKTVVVKNLAPGKYQVVQTAVGGTTHVKASSPITFWVGDDGKIYPDDNGNKGGAAFDNNTIVFTNSKNNDNFALPFTGTTASRIFTITGICVMIAAGVFIFIVLKKKDEDEEENKG